MEEHRTSKLVIEKATREELLAEKTRLEQEALAIKSQLTEARAHQKLTGEYADADWYSRAVNARTARIARVHRINQQLRKLKEQRSRSIQAHFVDCARELLDIEVYQVLLAKAVARYEDS